MTDSSTLLRLVTMTAFVTLAGCEGGAGGPGNDGGSGGRDDTGITPAPLVPPDGQFYWTSGGVTVTVNESETVNGLKAVGYRFSGSEEAGWHLVIDAIAADGTSNFCHLSAPGNQLPAIGSHPVGGANEIFRIICTDPTAPSGATLSDTVGEVRVTKAAPADFEGTFTISDPLGRSASGGFNIGCLYPDCVGPRR